MGTLNNAGGQQRHDGQKNYQNSNERNPDHVRDNTRKHQYSDHESLTNDENFAAGVPTTRENMDFRDKEDNLEDSENQ